MRLLRVHDEYAVTTSRLSIEERVLHYLAGVNYLDPALRMLRDTSDGEALTPSHAAVVEQAVQALGTSATSSIVQLIGDDATGHEHVARRIAGRLGLRLRSVQADVLPESAAQLDELAALWNCDSALLGNALLVCARESETSVATRFATRLSGLVFIAALHEAPLEGSAAFSRAASWRARTEAALARTAR